MIDFRALVYSSMKQTKTVGYFLLAVSLIAFSGPAWSEVNGASGALRQEYLSMVSALQNSPLKRAVMLESVDHEGQLGANLSGVLEKSLADVASVAKSPQHWCEIILLLSNTKACKVVGTQSVPTLQVTAGTGKSADTTGANTSAFKFAIIEQGQDYLDIALVAPQGPMGLSDIQLAFQAVSLGDQKSYLRMRYSYHANWFGRMTMQVYLQTLGRGKVGFSKAPSSQSSTNWIEGPRSVIERNTMRYFLGLECALQDGAPEMVGRFYRLAECWYSAVEQYPIQLHEMTRSEYLQMKASEFQQSSAEH